MRTGVDLGGSKIEVVTLDAGGAELIRRRVPTPVGDYRAIVEAIAGLVDEARRTCGGAASLGVGIPGSLSPDTGLVRNANSVILNGRPLRQDLEARLGQPVRIANDANCFALSEAVDGAAAGVDTVFGAILGTGVGGGLVRQGSVIDGRNLIAGEWGHNPQPGERGRTCWCGRADCVETWLSGPAMAADHRAAGGADLTARTIAERAAAGDAAAGRTMERWLERLARALAGVVNLLDPDAIVLGGGLSGIAAIYRELPGRMAPVVFSDVFRTPVLPPAHGDSGGVRGAAWLWPADPEP